MLDPLVRRGSPLSGTPAAASHATAKAGGSTGQSFRALMLAAEAGGRSAAPAAGAGGPAVAPPGDSPWAGLVRDVDTRRRELDGMMRRALRGEDLGARELLVWQAQVYAYSQQVELVSRVADRTVQGVKLLLNTQL
ncbi:MAG: hypothetical protein IPL40_11495 [Proteobacteria bacterium]|nr:hypothetical protein [Pseudomonadota bacterium]